MGAHHFLLKAVNFLSILFSLSIVPGVFDGHAACQSGDFTVPENAVVRYGIWEPICLEHFWLANCIGGKGNLTEYNQCIYVPAGMSNILAGWKWNWPAVAKDQLKSYMNISFGKTPWNKKTTNPLLPLPMGKIEEITVSYDIVHQASGFYNLTFDIWVTKTPDVTDPPEANIIREIMVKLDEETTMELEKVEIDDEEYGLWKKKGILIDYATKKEYTNDCFYFYKSSPKYSGYTKIHLFLDYLLKNMFILPTDYLRNIDLGNEVWYGRGETVFTAYSITIKTGGVSQTVKLENKMPLAVIMLMARHAKLKNAVQMKYDSSAGWENIGSWTNTNEEIHWDLPVLQTGTYMVTAEVACGKPYSGSMVDVFVDTKKFTFTVPDTGGWLAFTDLEIGSLPLKTGTHKVVVKASSVKSGIVGNLQSVIFSLEPD